MTLLVFGTIAVFIAHRDAGPVALLVVGALLLVLAVIGYLPTRLKWEGKGEIEWQQEVGEAFADFVESTPTRHQEAVLPLLASLSNVAPAATAAPLRALTRRQELRISVDRSLPEGCSAEWERPDVLWDGLITDQTGRTIGIELVAAAEPWDMQTAWQVIANISASQDSFPVAAYLAISTAPPSIEVLARALRGELALPKLVVVDKVRPSGDPAIREALEEVFASLHADGSEETD